MTFVPRIKILFLKVFVSKTRNILKGDTSNNSFIELASHLGTHIDFPFHFSANGKKCADYSAKNFVFESVVVLDISNENVKNYLIQPDNLSKLEVNNDCDLLILKTNFTSKRGTEEYWNYNWGFAPESTPAAGAVERGRRVRSWRTRSPC